VRQFPDRECDPKGEIVEEASEMSVSVIGRYTLRTPPLSNRQSVEEIGHARKRSVSRYFLALLRLGIQILIILVLLGVVWVSPALS
jgi:hypothetical protein